MGIKQAQPINNAGYPQYEWALDAGEHPVHISQAQPGQSYHCPLCEGRMIPKLGDIKQHHFAHESLKSCTPEGVARAVAGHWIADQIQFCLNTRRTVTVTWTCPLCQQSHTADLLHDIVQVRRLYTYQGFDLDLVLLDRTGKVRAAVVLARPSKELLVACVQQAIAVIVVDVVRGHAPAVDLSVLLKGAAIYGGPCETQNAAAEQGVITDPDRLRDLLVQAVSGPPYHIYGTLDNEGPLTHVFTLGPRRLWLPPILWQRAVGGLHHSMSPTLQVTSQEWTQKDGAIIALYYITASHTAAIAVRRYPPGQRPYARLDDASFRGERLTAATVARSFAES